MHPANIPSRRALGLWLAVLALWVQMLLPAMSCPGGMAQPAAGPHNLCLAGTPSPAQHDGAPLHKGQCPACLSLHASGGGFVLPEALVLLHPFGAGASIEHPTVAIDLPRWSDPGVRARAPPIPT
jgi:hypothetical protein